MGFEAAAAFLPEIIGGAADVGAVAAEAAPAAAEIAPFASGADVLAAGGADVLGLGGLGDAGAALGAGAGAAADVGAAGATAADLGGLAGAGAGAGAGATAADLGGLAGTGTGVAADFAGGAVPAIDALGFASDVSAGLPANTAAVAETAANTGGLSSIPATIGGGAQSAGGVLPASAALPLPGSTTDVLNLSGANLGGLTGQQFAEVGASDVGLGGSGAPTGAGFDIGSVPPTPTASQADISGGMLGQPTSTGGAIPGLGGATAGGGGGAVTSGAAGGAGGGGGSSGGFDWWKAAGLGLAAAPLALTLARGQQEMPQQGQQSQAISSDVGAAGTTLLNNAMQGQVTPGQQSTLTLNRQAMINQARQQLFNQGIQNPEASSAWGGIVANIDNQIAMQQQQFLTANINEAFTGTGQAQGNLTNLASQQIALDNAYTQAIANAGRSLGSVVGQAGTRLL